METEKVRREHAGGYGLWAICLHWLIALLILLLIVLGFVMRRMTIDPALQFSLYQWHKSIGLIALGVAGLRAALWLFTRHPAPVPSLGPIEQKASHATHVALALLSLAVPLAGWAVASTSTLNIPTFFLNLVVIPSLPLARSGEAEDFWTLVHASAAYALLALAVLHATAALYHHFIRHDEVLLRMFGRSPQDLSDADGRSLDQVKEAKDETRYLDARNPPDPSRRSGGTSDDTRPFAGGRHL